MIEKIECTCIEAYTTRKMRDPNCCACSCDHNDLVEQLAKANERVRELDKGILEEIENRDNCEEWLDKLSDEISRYLGVDIGEHSSANNPWREALDSIPEGTLNKFAIEKQLETAKKCAFGSTSWVLEHIKFLEEQLRKEQW